MTKEEAIEKLKTILKSRKDKRGKTETDEALEIAIKALEQEETIPFDIELFQAGLMNMPDGMTNGDVIKAIFPKSRKIDTFDNGEGIYIYLGNRETIGFSMSWWNAPYKKSEE